MDPKTPLSQIAGFGPVYLNRLKRLGLLTVKDLLYHFPFRYDDLSLVKKIADLTEGEVATVQGKIWQITNLRIRSGRMMTKALVQDGSGSLPVVWFNQPYLAKTLSVGTSVALAGKVSFFSGRLSLTSPDFEVGGSRRHTGRIVPVYPETAGLSSKWLRAKLAPILAGTHLTEYLPREVVISHSLAEVNDALKMIHQPASWVEVERARRRLGFEELWLFQLAAAIRKMAWQKNSSPILSTNQEKLSQFIGSLPYQLTKSQNKVLQEILSDLQKPRPMNRLLQGDVGSGKTVVAAIAAYTAYLAGFKTALMAPTEILAQQHFQTLSAVLAPSGLKIGLRTGSKKTPIGDAVVGTHALLSQSAEIPRLGLVVIDEQHRFGVAQRALLRAKGTSPHTLTMTATPIPRSLALTLYGDLDLSVLDELPPGRLPVKTYLTPPEKRSRSYEFIREKISRGQQVFVVTPLIDPSESLTSVKSAKEEFDRLSREVFPDLKLGLLHGGLKSAEKEKVLGDFRSGQLNILVSTPVVEVGIDIPNATVMIIEGAERFGLAALHQLRGRIGRGSIESWCLLFSEDHSPKTQERLRALESSRSGAELAELDLKLRGPGEIYGLRQSGVPDLKVASLLDHQLTAETSAAVSEYLAKNPQPSRELSAKLKPLLSAEVAPD